MDNKLNLSQLTDLFCEKSGMSRNAAAVFVKSFFETIIERVSEGEQVKVKGFGTFKQSVISDRESINVNTGERIVIPGHAKITFTPDQSLKDIINKPFENFETIVMDAPSAATAESIAVSADVPKNNVDEEPVSAEESPAAVAEEAEQPEMTQDSVVEETVNAEAQCESVANDTVQPEKQQDTAVAEQTEKDAPKNKVSFGRVVARTAMWISGIALAALILSYIIWPVSLLHLFRLEADRLTADENASVAVQVDTVAIVRNESVISSISSKPEEKIEEPTQAKDGKQQDKTVEKTGKQDNNPRTDQAQAAKQDITSKKNQEASEPKETAGSPAAEKVAKPATEPVGSGNFRLTAADEAKDLSLFTIADTTSYRMSGTMTVHTMANGETLTRVALKYYGTKKMWPYIAAYNHISNVNSVHAGQRLTIPVLIDK